MKIFKPFIRFGKSLNLSYQVLSFWHNLITCTLSSPEPKNALVSHEHVLIELAVKEGVGGIPKTENEKTEEMKNDTHILA